jgi:hypothetical protein
VHALVSGDEATEDETRDPVANSGSGVINRGSSPYALPRGGFFDGGTREGAINCAPTGIGVGVFLIGRATCVAPLGVLPRSRGLTESPVVPVI